MSFITTTENLHQAGIYQIVNNKGFCKYVGQSLDIEIRWKDHICSLHGNRHFNKHLQYAWNKYGERHFQFSVIEFCRPRDLDEREQYWICRLKPEYNVITDIKMRYTTNKATQQEYKNDENHEIKRPTWHKYVYGGQKRSR